MKRLGIAQIGVGNWGRNVLRNFVALEEAQVHVVCDHDDKALAGALRIAPSALATQEAEDAIRHPEVEAVVIATQVSEHADLVIQALEAGKHVFVEKPLARTTDEAQRIADLADQKSLTVMVGHLLLFHPAFEYARASIASGVIGELRYLYAVRVNLGVVRSVENALESLATHDMAVALNLIESRPVSVSANGAAFLQKGVEDVVFASITFESGQLAHFHASWLDPHKVRRLTIVGSRKMIVIDDMEASEKVRVYDKSAESLQKPSAGFAGSVAVRTGDILIPHVSSEEPLAVECRHFVEAVQSGSAVRPNAHDGLAVVRLLEAARRSLSRGGAPISLD